MKRKLKSERMSIFEFKKQKLLEYEIKYPGYTEFCTKLEELDIEFRRKEFYKGTLYAPTQYYVSEENEEQDNETMLEISDEEMQIENGKENHNCEEKKKEKNNGEKILEEGVRRLSLVETTSDKNNLENCDGYFHKNIVLQNLCFDDSDDEN